MKKSFTSGLFVGFMVGGVVTVVLIFYYQTIQRQQQTQYSLLAQQQQVEAVMMLQPERISQHNHYDNNNNNNGWKSIDVFYGNHNHMIVHENKMAQANQDTIVAVAFGNKSSGYYIDLAANDATYLSNTYNLERYHNWTGLCIEPNPEYWRSLSYRNCHVVACVIGHTLMEEIEFRIEKDGALGGIVNPNFDNKPKKQQQQQQQTKTTNKYYTVTLTDILQRFHAPQTIDYMSLDVEGAEYYIMSSFPFDMYTITLLTIERPRDELRQLLQSKNYVHVCDIAEFGETLWSYKPHIEASIVNITSIQAFCV